MQRGFDESKCDGSEVDGARRRGGSDHRSVCLFTDIRGAVFPGRRQYLNRLESGRPGQPSGITHPRKVSFTRISPPPSPESLLPTRET